MFSLYVSKYSKATIIILLNLPMLLIIDYGHFQYNGVSLGLFIFALVFMLKRQDIKESDAIISSFFFMSSILYLPV